jgi:hypothetical protein
MAITVNSTFTAADNTALTAYTDALGVTYTRDSSSNDTVAPKIVSNKLVAGEAGTNSNYYSSATQASADYPVSVIWTYNGASGEQIGPCARMDTAGAWYCFEYYNGGGTVILYKRTGGTQTIEASLSFTPSNGASYEMVIEPVGTTINCRIRRVSDSFWLNSSGTFVSGTQTCLSPTDSSITGAGRAGVRFVGAGGSDSTIDNLVVGTATAATTITLSGPSTGLVSVASTNFTVGADGTITGTITVTPSDGGSGGTFTPTTVAISSGTPTATFTYTPASTGVKSITLTNNGSLSNPSAFSYTSTAALKYTRVDTTDTIGGQSIMVLVPSAAAAIPYNSSNPTNVIVFGHARSDDQTGMLGDSGKPLASVNALLDAGYILVGTNARGVAWGTQQSVDDHVAAWKYVKDNYNTKNVALWCVSMGGLPTLSVLAQGKIPAVGWYGINPVCSLANLYSLGTYTSDIDTAYSISGSGSGTYANRTFGLDPLLSFGDAWRHVPMRMTASTGDTVVPKADNADALAALVATRAREAVVVTKTGAHGDPSMYDDADVAAFFARCFATPVALGRPASTKSISITLTTDGTTAAASLTGLKWAFWEQATPDIGEYPVDKGTAETTDGSGVLAITVRTNLASSGIGWLVVTDSDGTTTQSPAYKRFAGPVQVT